MLRKIINSKTTGGVQSMVKYPCQQTLRSEHHLKLKAQFSQELIDDCMTIEEFDQLLTKAIEESYETFFGKNG